MIIFMALFSYGMVSGQQAMVNGVFSNGGTRMIEPGYVINCTLGQSLIDKSENTIQVVQGGFWYSMRTYVNIIMPENLLPIKFELFQNYPNPFNPVTKIMYAIPKSALVRLEIYNVLGQRISMPVNENQQPGFYTINFDASNLSSGYYFYHLLADEYSAVKKLLVTK
jgi:hypothetical protein